ncbi:MAG: PIN domain-containing protein [Actinomycetota bacterium]
MFLDCFYLSYSPASSGLLSPFGSPDQIIRQAASRDLKLCYDSRILSEYRSGLIREKFSFCQDSVNDSLEQIKINGHLTAAKPLARRLPDEDDEPFLEVALASEAQYLVVENLQHSPARKARNKTGN